MKNRRFVGRIMTLNAIVGLSLFVLMFPLSGILPILGLSDDTSLSVLWGMFGGTMALGVVDLVLLFAGYGPAKFRDDNAVPSVLPHTFPSFTALQEHLERSFSVNGFFEKKRSSFDGTSEIALYASNDDDSKWTSVLLLHLPVLDEDSLQHGWEMAKSLLEVWLEDNSHATPILALICADKTALSNKRLNKGLVFAYEKSEATAVVLKLDQQQVHMAILPAHEAIHTGMMKFALHLLGISKKKRGKHSA